MRDGDGAPHGWTPGERAVLRELDEVLDRWADGVAAGLPEPVEAADPGAAGSAREGGRVQPPARVPAAGAASSPWGGSPWVWAALAAAVVGLFFVTDDGPGGPDAADPRPVGAGAERGVSLQASGLDVAVDGSFMVVPTRDPDIAVVWILDEAD